MTAENDYKNIAAELEAQNSELRATLAHMHETDRRKDEFLARLAHELRNPLAPIRQASRISQSTTATAEQKNWSQEVITRQVHHMSQLLDGLLDISHIACGTLELHPQNTALASVIETAVQSARPALEARRQRLTIESPREPLEVSVDPLRLAQVLSNLLTNAAKFTQPEGDIRLTSALSGGEVVIRVSDNGIGIAPEVLPEIFQMFSKSIAVRERPEGGLGIGLALSHGLVALHSGRLEAHSAGLGQGSEFSVFLPGGNSAAPARAVAAVEEPHPPRRVLIADDNLDAGESLAMLLRLDGHEVTLASNGTEAVELFEHMKPDFAILDIGMPGLNGYEVARRIRDSGNKQSVLIAVTGWGQDADKARAAEAGFDHHFTKPVEPSVLSALISS